MPHGWILTDESTLVWGSPEVNDSIRALTFGVMAELAEGKIEHYRSDLWHDARWLHEELTGPMEFEWVVRDSGTHIGESATHIRGRSDYFGGNPDCYKLHLLRSDTDKWTLQVWKWTEVEEEVVKTIDLDQRETVSDEMLNLLGIPTPKPEPELIAEDWATKHSALDVEDCSYAKTVAGCVYHPAPVYGWPEPGCTGYKVDWTLTQHDGDTCPVHEYAGRAVEDESFPAVRNNEEEQVTVPTTKGNTMESILNDLRSKLDRANEALDEAEEVEDNLNNFISDLESSLSDAQDKQSEIETFVGGLRDYRDEVEELINSLDRLPEFSDSFEFSTYVDDFDADLSFDSSY